MTSPFTHVEDSLFQALIYLLASVTTNTPRHLPLPRQIGSLRLPHRSTLVVEPLQPLPPDPTLGLLSQTLLQAALLFISLFRSHLLRARPLLALCIRDPPSSLLVRCVKTYSVSQDTQLTGRHSRLSKPIKGNGPNSYEILAFRMVFHSKTPSLGPSPTFAFHHQRLPSPSAHRHLQHFIYTSDLHYEPA